MKRLIIISILYTACILMAGVAWGNGDGYESNGFDFSKETNPTMQNPKAPKYKYGKHIFINGSDIKPTKDPECRWTGTNWTGDCPEPKEPVRAWFDPVRKEYHLLLPSGAEVTVIEAQ